MFFSEEKVSEIIEKNDIVDIISQYMTLKKRGNSYIGLCPFHTEKTPSFNVSLDKQLFYCFGCGVGGNIITFLQKIERMNYVECLHFLAKRARISIDDDMSKKDLEKIKKKELLFRINKEAARFFHNNLKNNSKTMNYLLKRGLNKSVITSFGLGFSLDIWDGLKSHLNSNGFPDELIEEAGLIIKRKDKEGYYDRFRNRVIFPIIDLKGNVIAFGGRVMDDSNPKYLNSPETDIYHKGDSIFALNFVKNISSLKDIIIVEGYMDVISLHQFGIKNAVASLGTAFTQKQARLLKRYSNKIIISYDSDTAGQSATLKGLSILEKEGCNVRVAMLPKGYDPDDYVREKGALEFNELVNKSLSLVEYKIHNAKKGVDIDSLEGRVSFTKQLAEILNIIESPVEVDAYIKEYARKMRIREEAIYAELRKVKNKHTNGNNRHNIKGGLKKIKIENGQAVAEKKLLNISVLYPDIAKEIFSDIKPEFFSTSLHEKIARIINLRIKEGKIISAGEILTHLKEEVEIQKAAEVFNIDLSKEDKESYKLYKDKILEFQKNLKIQNLTEKMNEYYKIGDRENANKVFIEILNLQKKKK